MKSISPQQAPQSSPLSATGRSQARHKGGKIPSAIQRGTALRADTACAAMGMAGESVAPGRDPSQLLAAILGLAKPRRMAIVPP